LYYQNETKQTEKTRIFLFFEGTADAVVYDEISFIVVYRDVHGLIKFTCVRPDSLRFGH